MLVLSAFFSGAEIAYVAANRLRTEAQALKAGWNGRLVTSLLENPTSVITTALVGNNLALVVYSTLMSLLLHDWIKGWSGGAEPVVLLIETLIASVIVLILGEVIPKSIAQQYADRAVFVLAVPIQFFRRLLRWISWVCESVASFILRVTGLADRSQAVFHRRELEVLLRESQSSGSIEIDEEDSVLLANVLDLDAVRVKESMVPRTDIQAIEAGASLEEVQEQFRATGHSKLPVYREGIDQIVGLVMAYDLFHHPKTLEEIIRPVHFVPDTKRSKDLLLEFLASRMSIAIVIDEYGGTAGLVTIEDLIEELTGEIHDEHDEQEFIVRQLDERTFVLNARAEIDELAERWGIALPEGDYETVAGLVLDHLGHIPEVNEEFDLAGFRFLVLRASQNRVELIKATRIGEG
ncbi:MAG: hemolysin family protein [Bacteroidota bacterium]